MLCDCRELANVRGWQAVAYPCLSARALPLQRFWDSSLSSWRVVCSYDCNVRWRAYIYRTCLTRISRNPAAPPSTARRTWASRTSGSMSSSSSQALASSHMVGGATAQWLLANRSSRVVVLHGHGDSGQSVYVIARRKTAHVSLF
jgi:hypothetical protein